MTFQRSRSSLLGQKPEIVSDLITTSEKVEKKKKKNAGKKPKGKYLLLCACLHFKVARREFPVEMFPFTCGRASQGICCC